MDKFITADATPALGDVRQMGEGDTVWLAPGMTQRPDWVRCLAAVAHAVRRGADARWGSRG
ncbi:hypothetical protein [Streptomyces sp. NPDC059063]|uniref:hypothetical protein n=1 Tax=Streptomyces sp. NPDC059063 TaxID=3346712 RepID=UPI003698C649